MAEGLDLEGKRVLVTGAASGIGRAVATAAAARGASVDLLDKDHAGLEVLAKELGDAARAHVIDVGDESAWAAVCEASPGGWRYAHLNAGIMATPPNAAPEDASILNVPSESYRRTLSVNVDGVFYGLRAVLPEMPKGGAVVLTASAAGLIPFSLDVVYSLTKHAVVGLARGTTHPGVRICAICPGGVMTNIVPDDIPSDFMMEPETISAEVLDLWAHGSAGEIRAKITTETPAQRVDAPKLEGWPELPG